MSEDDESKTDDDEEESDEEESVMQKFHIIADEHVEAESGEGMQGEIADAVTGRRVKH